MKRPRLTQESHGTTYLRPAAMPLIVAAIAVPVVAAMLLGVVTIEGTALCLAAGAAAVAALLVIAARARPGGTMEVAAHQDAERRLLVLATGEVTPEAAEAIRLREEVKALKERLHVLERIATEKENSLAQQIEELRDR